MTELSSALTEGSVVRPEDGVRVRNFRGRLVVARVDQAVQLEDAGALIWRQLDGVRTVAQVGDAVATEYDVAPDEARADTVELLTELAGLGLVTAVTPGTSGSSAG